MVTYASGIEFSIDWSEHAGDFNYGINFNGSFNKNVVLRIANAEGIIHGEEDVLSEGTLEMYRAQVGYPIGYFYGYKTAGVSRRRHRLFRHTSMASGSLRPSHQTNTMV